MIERHERICVLGGRGLVGSSLVRSLQTQGFTDVISPGRAQVDLREQASVRAFFLQQQPRYVIMAAGTVGGIMANSTRPADFIYDNTMMAANVVESCRLARVQKLMLLGSTCIYPKHAPQPIQESSLLQGALEPTNEWYAVAKIAAIKMGQAYRRQYGMDIISVMPTNLYGPGDNFDPETSHVLPGLMRKMHDAKREGRAELALWGTGKPRREFLFVGDLVEALVFLMDNYSDEEIINVGSGVDLTIADLAALVADKVGFRGQLTYDPSRPDGTPIKLTDISKILALGWKPKTDLAQGIENTYRWFLEHHSLVT